MHRLSDNSRGILFMCASMLAFTLNDTLMKDATQVLPTAGLPLSEAIFLRGVVATLGLLVLAGFTGGLRHLMPGRANLGPVALRTLAEIAATAAFLLALMHMPLANLSAILQSLPLAVTLAAAVFLKEPIGWRRLTAIAVGFVGMLIVIRPGGADFDRWSLLGLASVACVVLRDLSTRRFSRDMPSVVPAIWASAAVAAMGGVGMVLFGAVPPPPGPLLETSGAALFLIVGYMMAIMTMRVGDLGLVAPFRYTSLIWATLLGWLLFGTLPDFWTIVGAVIVVGSGLYMLLRQRQVRLSAEVGPRRVAESGSSG
jgi:drug/metabolite transporter (DMT)-like permease